MVPASTEESDAQQWPQTIERPWTHVTNSEGWKIREGLNPGAASKLDNLTSFKIQDAESIVKQHIWLTSVI